MPYQVTWKSSQSLGGHGTHVCFNEHSFMALSYTESGSGGHGTVSSSECGSHIAAH